MPALNKLIPLKTIGTCSRGFPCRLSLQSSCHIGYVKVAQFQLKSTATSTQISPFAGELSATPK